MSLCYRVSQQHSLALSFGNNGCLSLSKADMELIYIFLVTRGFERLQEDHQDVTVNIPKKSHWKKKISTAWKYQCDNQEPATYLTYTDPAE